MMIKKNDLYNKNNIRIFNIKNSYDNEKKIHNNVNKLKNKIETNVTNNEINKKSNRFESLQSIVTDSFKPKDIYKKNNSFKNNQNKINSKDFTLAFRLNKNYDSSSSYSSINC